MFLTKRLLLAVLALAILIPLAGCRHHCCKTSTASFAAPCCPPATALPPGALPPP